MQNNRHLIIIPVIHTHADMGSLGNKTPVGEKYETGAVQYWRAVSDYVQTLPVDFSELRVYQDGLPDVSPEIVEKIVDETPQTPNFDLLRWLKSKGTHILGTESPTALLKEFRALQAIFDAVNEEQKQSAKLEYAKASPYLLEGRDEYIAGRIKATLPEGGLGILFIGLAHEVKILLEKEMLVTEPEALIGASSESLRRKFSGKERVQ